ncbi:Thioredoxin reductase [Archaeoglobus sulfaticallidus PM70-1]|uniref:Thioredoxin reductase n=1 Tax=Archaeoglobus sulfaticallidus PM70-1 TaxID=387631 RepID=N0BFN3_9EURY|nr:FAD-dependent oxidoreductase [Archaeoglobus sulfaticallidus]AGK61072.1 Thioredoxin reductase [Archaeoglobus sulfaticallidus PM70-1]
MRLTKHPILEFKRGREVTIYFNQKPIKAYEGETVASALYANGITTFSRSFRFHRPRGFFCAIGKCSSCMMEVDGVPNIRVCKVYVRDGMMIRTQNSFPNADKDIFGMIDSIIDRFYPHGSHYKKFNRPKALRDFVTKQIRNFAGIGNPPKAVFDEKGRYEEIHTDIAIIGGGPAGMSAAIFSARFGAKVTLMDENPFLGGQLVKQTHRFFGSGKHRAGTRGIKIAELLRKEVEELDIDVRYETKVFGIYNGIIGAVERDKKLLKIVPKKIVVATGAYERTLIFENNDLPGVYGAGGVQTLMNVFGVKPGNRGLIVGSGNVGLILSYQLMQAGVEVSAVVEAMPRIGGYFVHAAKIRRLGVPIYVSHTIKRAIGKKKVEGAEIVRLENWREVEGSEKRIDCDFICVATGLSPTHELLYQAGCQMKFVPELGGLVPVRNRFGETTVSGLYVAGDVAGIEEATSAMMEGRIAGLDCAIKLGYGGDEAVKLRNEIVRDLKEFREGPFGERILAGLKKVEVEA